MIRSIRLSSDVLVTWIAVACLVGLLQTPDGSVARTVLGLAVILVVPGYLLVALLFPVPGEIQGFYRLVLSLPISVAVISLIGLGLSRTSWGLTLTSFVASLGAFAAISGILVMAHRLYRQPIDGSTTSLNFLHTTRVLRGGPLRPWPLLGVSASVVAAMTLIIWLLVPVASQPLTEFYILDNGGGTDTFPRFVKSQEPVKVTLVLINREETPLEYTVEARYAGTFLKTLVTGLLQPGEQWRWPTEVVIPAELQDPNTAHKLEFVLYKGGGRTSLGTVHLWLDSKGD